MHGPGDLDFSRSQIDKLGDRLKSDDDISSEDLALLASFQFSLLPLHDRVREEVGMLFREVLPDETYEPTSRVKQLRSIVAKLRRMSTHLSSIQDLVGFRVVVPDTQAQQELAQRVAQLANCRIIDRREQPINGYRAVHAIRREGFRSVEVQIRTLFQHFWAESSERTDRDVPGLKYGQVPESHQHIMQSLMNLSRNIQAWEAIEQQITALDLTPERRAIFEDLRNSLVEDVKWALQLQSREAGK